MFGKQAIIIYSSIAILLILSALPPVDALNWKKYSPYHRWKKTYSADVYLNSRAITYGKLKEFAEKADGRNISFIPNPFISDDTKLVRVGFHGTTGDNAASIAHEGIKPSFGGIMGPRVYTTPYLNVAAMYALGSSIKMRNNMMKNGTHDSICHIFLTVKNARNLKIFRVKARQYDKLVEEKLYKGIGFPFDDHTIVSKKGGVTNFPYDEAEKLITFCEPLKTYKSNDDYMKTMLTHMFKAGFIWRFNLGIAKKFQKNSLLKTVKTIDMTKLAKLTGQRYMDFKSVPEKDRCDFCILQKKRKIFDYETDNVLVFKDIMPQAKHHMLAIPKSHDPSSVVDLRKSDIPLVRKLKYACDKYFDKHEIDRSHAIYGFHIPNYVSVKHLHLHCLIPPFIGFASESRFDEEEFAFITYDNVIRKLEKNKKIKKLGPFSFLFRQLWKNKTRKDEQKKVSN